MSILRGNHILDACKAKIESQLTPQNRANYERIVVAGMKVGLKDGPNSIIASIRKSQNPIEDCAKGAVGMCVMLFKESRGTMPIKAMVPAGMTLLLEALDFADRTGVVKVGQPELVQATHIFTNTLFHVLGITPQMLHTAAAKVHALTQDPAAMEKIKRAGGFSKDPRAASAQAPAGNDEDEAADEDENAEAE